MNHITSLRQALKAAKRFASIRRTSGLAALMLGSALWSTSSIAAVAFTGSYKNGTNCNSVYKIAGAEPSDTAKHPVFIYMVGTTEKYNNGSAMAAVNGMAQRGYVAATVEYPNASFGSCTTLTGRSKCIFNASSAQSAVAAVCARAKADCSKGIVVGGFSQGSILATLAKNYDTRVRAAYGMGEHVRYAGIYDLSTCVGNGKRALPSNRLRVINGQEDVFVGSSLPNVRNNAQEVTGYKCAGTTCFQPDGSGWRIVLNSEVQDGSADHCYMRANGCLGNQDQLDQNWLGGADWALKTNLDWLTQFTSQ